MKQTLYSMTTIDLVKLLKKFGSKTASLESVNEFLSDGRAKNKDGSINIIKFIAYLGGHRNGKLQ